MNLFTVTQCPSRVRSPGMEPDLLRTSGTLTSVLGNSLVTYGYRTHVNKTFGGNGEIRTHGAIADTTVFKTVAINRTLPHFQISWGLSSPDVRIWLFLSSSPVNPGYTSLQSFRILCRTILTIYKHTMYLSHM